MDQCVNIPNVSISGESSLNNEDRFSGNQNVC